jgi:hypothetical protein
LSSQPDSRQHSFFSTGGAAPNLERAAKAASNELKGANSYFRFFFQERVAISVPTQLIVGAFGVNFCSFVGSLSVVDHRGYRIVAMPILPLSEKHGARLVYGSAGLMIRMLGVFIPLRCSQTAARPFAATIPCSNGRWSAQRLTSTCWDIKVRVSVCLLILASYGT